MGNVVLDYSQIFEKVNSLPALRVYSVIGVKHGDPLLVTGSTTTADGGGGLYVWNAFSTAPDNNTSVIKPTAILNAGRWITITLPMALPPIPPAKYSVPFGFTTPLLNNETMLIHTFSVSVVFPTNWEGATGTVGINPQEATVFTIRKNGSEVGSIEVDPSGSIDFIGSGVTFDVGDVLSVNVSEEPDKTIENTAFTLLGTQEG